MQCRQRAFPNRAVVDGKAAVLRNYLIACSSFNTDGRGNGFFFNANGSEPVGTWSEAHLHGSDGYASEADLTRRAGLNTVHLTRLNIFAHSAFFCLDLHQTIADGVLQLGSGDFHRGCPPVPALSQLKSLRGYDGVEVGHIEPRLRHLKADSGLVEVDGRLLWFGVIHRPTARDTRNARRPVVHARSLVEDAGGGNAIQPAGSAISGADIRSQTCHFA